MVEGKKLREKALMCLLILLVSTFSIPFRRRRLRALMIYSGNFTGILLFQVLWNSLSFLRPKNNVIGSRSSFFRVLQYSLSFKKLDCLLVIHLTACFCIGSNLFAAIYSKGALISPQCSNKLLTIIIYKERFLLGFLTK